MAKMLCFRQMLECLAIALLWVTQLFSSVKTYLCLTNDDNDSHIVSNTSPLPAKFLATFENTVNI